MREHVRCGCVWDGVGDGVNGEGKYTLFYSSSGNLTVCNKCLIDVNLFNHAWKVVLIWVSLLWLP